PGPAPTAPSSRGAKLRPAAGGSVTVPTMKTRVVTLQPLASAPMPAAAAPPMMTAPDPVVIKAPAARTPTTDPLAVVHQLEAWMPEMIAKHKMRDFIHDVGGELIE